MKNFRAYFYENIRWLAVILFIALVMTATMLLNQIPLYEIGYGMLLCAFVTVVAILVGYGRHRDSFRQLEQMQENIAAIPCDMKTPEYMYERQYQECIRAIAREKDRLQKEMRSRQQDLAEYYSMWVHQIKTPIAALKLLADEAMNAYLDDEDSAENDMRVINMYQKQNELFRVEQYVDMALQYTRLGAQTNDFVFERVLLDEVIKPSILKYAKQFIHKQLRLNYVPQGRGPGAEEGQKQVRIIIEDTGIGISADDLPRVCEMGYTGYNGHADQYSTGIGLYLCRAILDKLGHQFVITSDQGRIVCVQSERDLKRRIRDHTELPYS